MTEAKIIAKYKARHDKLTKDYYSGKNGLGKKKFDALHGQIWKDLDTELMVEGYRQPPVPARDLAKEIDEIKTHLGLA